MQHEIRGEVSQHRRFKAILPEEIAEGNPNHAVEENGTRDQQGSQPGQRGSSRQMTQAKDDRGENVGEPERPSRRLAPRHMPDQADQPGQQREQEQTTQQFFSDAAIEARQEAFPQGGDWNPVRMACGRRGQNTVISRSSRKAAGTMPKISAGATIASA